VLVVAAVILSLGNSLRSAAEFIAAGFS